MHHLAHDGAGADERNLHYNVIKILRLQARQRGLLGAAFHLEHADGVARLQGLIDLVVILRKLAEVNFFAPVIADQADAVFEQRHHAESEQIDLDDLHVGAIVFIPLNHYAAWHGCRFQRDDGIEPVLANDHAAGMLAEMARHVLQGRYNLHELASFGIGDWLF